MASRIDLRIEHAKNVGDAINLICKSKPVAIINFPGVGRAIRTIAGSGHQSCPRHRAIPIALVTGNPKAESLFDQYQPDAVIAKSRDMTKAIGRFFTSLGLNIQRNTQKKNTPLPLSDYKSRILLAEDSQCVQRLLGRFLHVAGADVTVVGTGIAALEAVEESTFDLILMDIEMPEMDGRMATMRLRDNGVTTPIIALTAHSHENSQRRQSRLASAKFSPNRSIGSPWLIRARSIYHYDPNPSSPQPDPANGQYPGFL